MIEVTKDIIGKKVVFTNSYLHQKYPVFYPKFGTVGVVISVNPNNQLCNIFVQWPEDSTLGDDKSFCRGTDLKLVD